MALKPTQFRFQVAAADGSSVQVNITMDGNPLWSGSLAHTTDTVIRKFGFGDTPYSTAACDIDMPVTGVPVTEAPRPAPERSNLTDSQSQNKLMTISVTGGDVVLTGIAQQYNPTWIEEFNPEGDPPTKWVYIGGNPEFSDWWNIVTQPLWNGVPDLIRYNIAQYLGISGPGSVRIMSGETCEFTAQIWNYCLVIT